MRYQLLLINQRPQKKPLHHTPFLPQNLSLGKIKRDDERSRQGQLEVLGNNLEGTNERLETLLDLHFVGDITCNEHLTKKEKLTTEIRCVCGPEGIWTPNPLTASQMLCRWATGPYFLCSVSLAGVEPATFSLGRNCSYPIELQGLKVSFYYSIKYICWQRTESAAMTSSGSKRQF